MSTHTLVLGLDCATWDLLDPWIAAGLLPNLGALRARGAWGELRSTVQPVTSAAWPTFLTGKNQGKHGIYDFVRRRPDSYGVEMTNASMLHSPTIYDHLSAADKRVASINMPYTFPPRPLNGVVIGGLFATVTGPSLTYPSTLWDEVARVAPRYCIAPDYDASAPDPLQHYIDAMHDSIDQRFLVAEHLLAQDWDLFTLVFTEPDEIQHAFWHCLPDAELPPSFADHPQRFGNPILDVYQRIDRGLPRLLELAGPEVNVWLVSDHGGGALGHFVYLNRALEAGGLLRFKEQAQASRSSRLHDLARLYKRSLPNSARARVRRLLGNSRFERLKGHLESRISSDAIDWAHTKAYSLGTWGNVYINLAGREPQGTVQPGAAYEHTCREVSELLLSLRHPETGQPAVASVRRREELYHGPMADQSPDLMVTWADPTLCGHGGYDAATSGVFERRITALYSDLPLTGFHRELGVLLAAGPAVATRGRLPVADIADVAPTLLASFGLAVPEDMDGRVLELLHPALTPQQSGMLEWNADPYRYSAEEEALIQKRLEDLGYM
jgi:predicted AlkP superfamily phosphohydrolase/phosphomutase